MPDGIAEWLGSMINMDAPKHTKMRLIVNRGFTPRQVARIDDSVREQAKDIVDRVAPMGECDFVSEIAAALPLQIICDMMGIPREDTKQIFEHTNVILGVGDPEYVQTMEQLMAAGMGLFQYGLALAQDRLDNPRDDITTQLMHAEVEDENGKHRLTTGELGSFFLLLVVAGNETTRNAISGGMYALTQHPEQWERLKSDESLLPTAADEIVRWVSPVNLFRRTPTKDVEIGGQPVKKGEKVVIYYSSANRDESVFDNADVFDIGREPNPHVGFGGGGPHFCLGRHLAKLEIECLFRSLVRQCERVELVAEPRRLRSNFINGIKEMQVRFVPAKASS
jgi:cholest-4-en-3-one 26-monooxygenase